MATNYATILGIGGAVGVATNNTTVYSVGYSDTNLYSLTPNGKSTVTNLGYTGYMLVNVGNYLYITSFNSNILIKYNISSNTITSTLSLSTNPNGIATDGSLLYISNIYGNNVIIVDISAFTIQNPNYITGLNNPLGLTFDNTGALWICEYSGDKVTKYVGSTLQFSFTISSPTSVTYNSNYLFVSSNIGNLGNGVYQYDLNGNSIGLFSNTPSPYQSLFYNNYFYAASFNNSSLYTYT